jgi:hypothetical protein
MGDAEFNFDQIEEMDEYDFSKINIEDLSIEKDEVIEDPEYPPLESPAKDDENKENLSPNKKKRRKERRSSSRKEVIPEKRIRIDENENEEYSNGDEIMMGTSIEFEKDKRISFNMKRQ